MSKYFRSGQFDLERLAIISKTDNPVELDMSNSYINVTLYESIFDMFMSGTLSFVDTNNIVNLYALGNGETVELEFKTSGVDESIKFSGIVYDITGPAVLNDHASGYTVHFMSPIAFNSMRSALFNAYKGQVSNFVSDVYKKISKDKPIDISQTKYVEDLVMTGQRPLEALQMFTRLAVSSNSRYGYLFYEDNQQFNFKPLVDLYLEDPVREFFYSSAPSFENVKNSHEEMFDVYQDFEYEEANKFIEKIKGGLFNCTTHHVGILTKSMETYEHDPSTYLKFDQLLGIFPYKMRTERNPTDKIKLSFNVEPRQSERDIEKNNLIKLKALETSINIGIFGDSTIRVGQTCIANIPAYSTEDFSPDSIDFLSGRFLISEIKHTFTPKQYNQRLLLIKDSYEETVA